MTLLREETSNGLYTQTGIFLSASSREIVCSLRTFALAHRAPVISAADQYERFSIGCVFGKFVGFDERSGICFWIWRIGECQRSEIPTATLSAILSV